MRFIPILLITLFIQPDRIQSQVLVTGEFDGWFTVEVNQMFPTATAALWDLDCDDNTDLSMYANDDMMGSWERWTLEMEAEVEVHNGNEGKPTLFHNGDTVPNASTDWTPFLDFVYGTGELGEYGHPGIDSAYLLFRKANGLDTAYLFVLVSSVGIDFTVHHGTATCPNPYIGIVAWNIESITNEALIYPNPSKDFVAWDIRDEPVIGVSAMAIDGRTHPLPCLQNGSDLSNLPPGIYLLILDTFSNRYAARLVKL